VNKFNLLVTAAHCLRSNGVNSTDIYFHALYPIPGSTYDALRVYVDDRWHSNEKYAYDFGIIQLKYPIMDGMPALGYRFNGSLKGQSWTSYGYPAASPFPGNALYKASDSYRGRRDTPSTYGMENDMTGGSSGGPWISDVSGAMRVMGLNSYKIVGQPRKMFSPYFSGSFCRVLSEAGGKCPP